MVMLYCGNHFETPPWKGEVNILWITECLFKFYPFVNFLCKFKSQFFLPLLIIVSQCLEGTYLEILWDFVFPFFVLTDRWFKRNDNRFLIHNRIRFELLSLWQKLSSALWQLPEISIFLFALSKPGKLVSVMGKGALQNSGSSRLELSSHCYIL